MEHNRVTPEQIIGNKHIIGFVVKDLLMHKKCGFIAPIGYIDDPHEVTAYAPVTIPQHGENETYALHPHPYERGVNGSISSVMKRLKSMYYDAEFFSFFDSDDLLKFLTKCQQA